MLNNPKLKSFQRFLISPPKLLKISLRKNFQSQKTILPSPSSNQYRSHSNHPSEEEQEDYNNFAAQGNGSRGNGDLKPGSVAFVLSGDDDSTEYNPI
jgi:hypothetical protein